MGNILSPAAPTKVGKLKHIVHVLGDQQKKLKRSKTDAQTRLRRSTSKMANHMTRKQARSDAYAAFDDDELRESAEDISHQRHRVLDLKIHINMLRTLQYKVQGIINAHFTQNALRTVNTAIKKTNITIQSVEKDQGNEMRAYCVRSSVHNPFGTWGVLVYKCV